jgi:hypothetical protein
MCRAANALHSGRFEWLQSALHDAELQRVIETWDALPEVIRIAVMALVGTVVPRLGGSPVPTQWSRTAVDATAWRLARDCREIVQGCLREEEWHEADREFFGIISKAFTVEERRPAGTMQGVSRDK